MIVDIMNMLKKGQRRQPGCWRDIMALIHVWRSDDGDGLVY